MDKIEKGKVMIEVTLLEAAVIKELRSAQFLKLTIFVHGGVPVRTVNETSKTLKESEEAQKLVHELSNQESSQK